MLNSNRFKRPTFEILGLHFGRDEISSPTSKAFFHTEIHHLMQKIAEFRLLKLTENKFLIKISKLYYQFFEQCHLRKGESALAKAFLR